MPLLVWVLVALFFVVPGSSVIMIMVYAILRGIHNKKRGKS